MSQPTVDRAPYNSDLTDEQWCLIADLVPAPESNRTTGGRPPKYNRREIVNVILYVCRTGCQWRMLPNDLPDWQTVYRHFCHWHDDGTFERINDRLRRTIRCRSDRYREPSAGIIDSQSVKIAATVGYTRFDGAKKANGRKRYIEGQYAGV